ncbi:hypothetical protein KVR01_002548 [Diaporthe batatas]|uniref:uncharacterized protein n=1 Tax=Diaporthe batatas TaxID=748121 RepID=UPI001D04951F|nr:uncharacterized protein KVR01_002548 [Diaporthe batatas]KAG8166859.1 hypothetical protein KVR01_002548 [Diaporthe batatas]
MSFASSLRKLLPSNRPEKGHAIRAQRNTLSEPSRDDAHTREKQETSIPCLSDETSDRIVRWNTAIEPSRSSISTPSTRTQQLYLAHREKRRRRRSLRESGDFLGVQGINPATGELDVLTPTSSSSNNTPSQFASLARTVADRKGAYEAARRKLQAEKMRKWERDKEAVRAELHRNNVRWTKRRSGWSSAIEPALSPIAQSSSAASTPRGGGSTGTVVRTPSARHASEDESEKTRTIGTAGALRRKPVPLSAEARALSSKRSYSDLIPPGRGRVGTEIAPSDSVSAVGALKARAGNHGVPPGRGRRPDRSTTTSGRQRSTSSALDFRSRSTPESDLDPSAPGSMTYEYYTDQQTSRKSGLHGGAASAADSKTSEMRSSSSALQRRDAGSNISGDKMSPGKSTYNQDGKKGGGGKICLHTHHHHYWILSDSVALQSMPSLRSSGQRPPLQKAENKHRLAAFPDESDVEGMAEARRPPSRNTNRRYFIDG